MRLKILLIVIFISALIGLSGTAFYQNRTAEAEDELSPFIKGKNTAIFAAYSQDGHIPYYVIEYLKALKQIAPNIVYITDNPIKRRDVVKLTPYVNYLIAKRHGEYDWGSFKRGYNLLEAKNLLPSIPNLIFANDSTLLVAPSLKPILTDFQQKNVDFYGVSANLDGTYHLQSYFLIFSPKVFLTKEFGAYLNAVKKETDGLTVAYRYEVPFTFYLTSLGFKSATYLDYNKLSYLPLNDKNCYPLTLLSKHHTPLLKMRTFTDRLNVQEPRRLVFAWLKKHNYTAYKLLLKHLKDIDSPYLVEAK